MTKRAQKASPGVTAGSDVVRIYLEARNECDEVVCPEPDAIVLHLDAAYLMRLKLLRAACKNLDLHQVEILDGNFYALNLSDDMESAYDYPRLQVDSKGEVQIRFGVQQTSFDIRSEEVSLDDIEAEYLAAVRNGRAFVTFGSTTAKAVASNEAEQLAKTFRDDRQSRPARKNSASFTNGL